MTKYYDVTWSETCRYLSKVEVNNADKMSEEEIRSYIDEQIYHNICVGNVICESATEIEEVYNK